MTAKEQLQDRAQYLGFSVIVWDSTKKPMQYKLLDDNYNTVFKGTYRESLSFLMGVSYEYRLYEG